MPKSVSPVAARPPSRPVTTGLAVSRYDQVAGLLLATLIVLGFVTLMMFLVWLSSRLFWVTPAVPVTVLEDVGGGGTGTGPLTGGQGELEAPSLDDFGAPVEPPIDDLISTVATVVAARTTELDVLDGDTTPASTQGAGTGTGAGDGRGLGPGGPGTSAGIPAYERWEVRMSAASLDEYARQLDYFRVELGVAGGGSPTVEYISNLSAKQPTVRVGNPKEERRLRFLHRSGELRQADRQLAAKAGVQTEGRIVFQFYSQPMYDTLLALENAKKGNRRISDVLRTVFGVRPTATGGYEFYVLEQHYIGGA